ncbi:unnamed protein product [Merluccius merluccius]
MAPVGARQPVDDPGVSVKLSASSAVCRGLSVGGVRVRRRCGVGDPRPSRLRPPSGAFPPRRCAATGSGSAWKGLGAKVAGGFGLWLYSASLLRPRRFLGPRTQYLAAPSSPLTGVGDGAPSPPA